MLNQDVKKVLAPLKFTKRYSPDMRQLQLKNTVICRQESPNASLECLKINKDLLYKNHSQEKNKEQLPINSSKKYKITFEETQNNFYASGEFKGRQYFFDSFKKLDKIQQTYKLLNKKSNHAILMLQKSEELTLVPCKLGLLGEDQNLNIKNQKIGDKYTDVITHALNAKKIENLNLSDNRITQQSSQKLLNSIGKSARSLHLSQNQIGKLGIEALINHLTKKENKLVEINLEDNKLGDKISEQLLIALCDSKVKIINLNKNLLTELISPQIAQFINSSNHVNELFLSWNSIKGQGAMQIFNILENNDVLKLIDLSYNSIGIPNGVCVKSLSKVFKKNSVLTHVDFSMNQFCLKDIVLLEQSIRNNHTIYGLHFASPFSYVDNKGFICTFTNEQLNVDHNKIGKQIKRKINENEQMINVCWICEGWNPFEFKINIDDQESKNVYIHLQIDQYQKEWIGKTSDLPICYKRMIPIGKTEFYFTTDSNKILSTHHDQLASDQLHANLSNNFIFTTQFYKVIEEHYLPTSDIYPRSNLSKPIKSKNKQKKMWTFPISIWAKEYKFENQESLNKCFERDWECSRIPRFVKKEEDLKNLKLFLESIYKEIKETYKYYSSLNPCGDIWAISINPLTEFVQTSNLIDNKTLKFSDVDLKFICTWSASSSQWKGNPRNPERYLIRYQFMEFLVRLSEDKYIKNQQAKNFTEAMMLMYDALKLELQKYDSHIWRSTRYFTEECDEVLKNYKNMIVQIYNMFSKKKVLPGQKRFMSLGELFELIQQQQFAGENIGERDINLAFNQSMMCQVDELESTRIFEMQELEFMEALARIADKLYGGEENDDNLGVRLERLLQELNKNMDQIKIKNIN